MPSTTPKQERFMAMCSSEEGRAAAKGDCPPRHVAQEFHAADKAKARGASGHDKATKTAQSYGFR